MKKILIFILLPFLHFSCFDDLEIISEKTAAILYSSIAKRSEAPGSPGNLAAAVISTTRIDLTWTDNSTNETGFRIQRSINSSANFADIQATIPAGTTSFSNTGLTANTTYFYRICAYNNLGSSGYSNVASTTTTATAPLSPGSLTAIAASSTQITLTWTDNSNNETGFKLQRSAGSNANFTDLPASIPAGATSFGDTGLSPNTTCYYRVYAYNNIGNSGYSNETSATTPPAQTSAQIIADHTIVSRYAQIPDVWINEVKKMWINVLGESHSEAYRTGLTLLQQQNSKFAVNVVSSGSPGTGTSALRVSNTRSSLSGSWTSGAGEAVWYTWYAWTPWGSNKDIIKNHMQYSYNQNLNLTVIGFGWCWDMTWTNDPGGTIDPYYNVRWAGSSEGGPNGDLIWGLNADDYALTNNHVCMDTYLYATEEYRSYCQTNGISTKVIFTTGPVDGYTGENGYQRHVKHEYMRNFVRADANRILFDYADILCYDDNGAQRTATWGSYAYPIITTTNLGDASIGHIGSTGALRLAKAQWWLLARIAGWDGN